MKEDSVKEQIVYAKRGGATIDVRGVFNDPITR